MAKYCPYMSHQNKWQENVECYGKECAWADKDGKCLIAKALMQVTDPISVLAQGHPADQNILHGQPNYVTHWVHQDTTTKADEGWGDFEITGDYIWSPVINHIIPFLIL